MTTPALMLQGTGSDVGKSLLVAGLCRLFARRGLRVRPFKPQNMSNNAAVTPEGGEIGRAQALQARACGVAPSVDMNPVLLKPESDLGAQLVVQGRRVATLRARDYFARKPELMASVLESYRRLAAAADLVIVEGAGSPAEVNLRAGDIANMGFAEAADLPVVLVADIDRGGVIASLVGTHAVVSEAERDRIKGFIINKFRGDVSLFDEGLAIVEARTGWRSFGVLPYWPGAAKLPAEDALSLDRAVSAGEPRAIKVAVPRLSRVANFDDLDPLKLEPDVTVVMVAPGEPLPGDADLVILPGSKSTIGDLAFLRAQGWDLDLAAHVRRGGRVLGLCAGFQMLGRRLADPEGIEGPPGEVEGLGLLELETVMTGDKRLVEVAGRDLASGAGLTGYEMHIGRTAGPALDRPWLEVAGQPEGAASPDGRVAGCYLHGLFASDAFRAAFLGRIRPRADGGLRFDATVEATLDGLADHLEGHLDVAALAAVAGL
ncbi:adenosylcobyric acid synthase (glutamine-hydrolysing) [Tistlia consotensis]|uniref:Cobyric acid synthase n=1 Tax=Tistlia consotensis USBA 355 TaxID=560819 RepID=A0A1Y6BUQ3_9PROT|nr:cobyric acid synthase [Tistlia consotensis]SMF22234.1 adenosylcobyric acid synthase (glutamine-hydrolysing) [Tistlia consotensis USBA 355]SNR46179.1 adenosylcobyric acid synthase (glutamine-hydrolysing) [Tistlia consotensis]